MRLEFYYDPSEENPWSDPEPVIEILDELDKKQEGINIKKVNTSEITEEKRHEIYSQIVSSTSSRRYKTKSVFSNKDRSEVFFGRQQPALLIYRDQIPSEIYAQTYEDEPPNKQKEKHSGPSDVYPHEKPGGEQVEPIDYLERLIKAIYYVGALSAPPTG